MPELFLSSGYNVVLLLGWREYHVKFVITPLNCIAAITAPVSAITAIITAAIHGGGVFDQQQEGRVLDV